MAAADRPTHPSNYQSHKSTLHCNLDSTFIHSLRLSFLKHRLVWSTLWIGWIVGRAVWDQTRRVSWWAPFKFRNPVHSFVALSATSSLCPTLCLSGWALFGKDTHSLAVTFHKPHSAMRVNYVWHMVSSDRCTPDRTYCAAPSWSLSPIFILCLTLLDLEIFIGSSGHLHNSAQTQVWLSENSSSLYWELIILSLVLGKKTVRSQLVIKALNGTWIRTCGCFLRHFLPFEHSLLGWSISTFTHS